MSEKPKIEVVIKHSTIHGDVVAGDNYKTTEVHVHVHKDKLHSETAVLSALAEQGRDIKNADEFLKEIVKNPDLWKKLLETRSQFEEEQVDQTINEMIKRFQATGPTPQAIKKLQTLFDECWKKEQWSSVIKIGDALLNATYNNFEHIDLVNRTAEKLYECASKHKNLNWAVPLARAYQAGNCFIIYARRIYDLKATLEINKKLSVQLPLVNLLSENVEALGYYKLTDIYIGEAVEKAFSCGHAETITHVLFCLSYIQYNAYFLVHHLLGQDAAEIRERVFRVNQILIEAAEKFGLQHDKAVAESNVASFFNMLGDYDKAEKLSYSAAQRLTELGFSYEANRALRINKSARNREKAVKPIDENQVLELSGEQLVKMFCVMSDDQMRLKGIDLNQVTELKEAIEGARRDLNPERVMKYCKNINLRFEPSPLAAGIGLPSLGLKTIKCKHFKKEIGAVDLDRAFDSFKTSLGCETCTHRTPRDDWKLTLMALEEIVEGHRST
jgi:hypothetical protein